jgi:hypothetical protein
VKNPCKFRGFRGLVSEGFWPYAPYLVILFRCYSDPEWPHLQALPAMRFDTAYRERRVVAWDGYIE